MRWRRNWSQWPPCPKVRRLSGDEQQQLLARMTKQIAQSPVLAGCAIQVRFLRARFCAELPMPSGVETWGRITPVDDEKR